MTWALSIARKLVGRLLILPGKRILRGVRAGAYRRAMDGPRRSGRTLVAMNAGIGNAIEATPLVQAIRSFWPRERITLLVEEWDLFDDWAVVDGVAHGPSELAGQRFDRSFVTWTAQLPGPEIGLAPGVVYHPPCLFDRRWSVKPEREYDLDMLRGLGYSGATPPLYASIKEPAEKIPEGDPLVCLAPGGKVMDVWRHKRWPYYLEFTRAWLDRHPGATLLVIGGPADEFPSEVIDGKRVVDLRGRLTLREVAWTLKRADLAVGNDCGPMHVADAVLTPTVTFFGPTCELKNGPRHHGWPLAATVSCHPCQYEPERMEACPDPRCMRELTVERALEAAQAALAARRVR